jgi:hypothetical protein
MDTHAQGSFAPRLRILALAIALACLLALAFSEASPASSTAASAAKHRVGGKVKAAWPRKGRPPRDPLTRWIAAQVGAVCPIAKHGHKGKVKRKKCLARLHRAAHPRSTRVSYASSGDPTARSSAVATTAPAAKSDGVGTGLALARSYLIPSDDPSYKRLLNWSWTFDSSIAAAALDVAGYKAGAGQLLDQLSALQYPNGSLDIAFDVSTGRGTGQDRAGTAAWLGLAASTFDLNFKSSRFLDTEQRTAKYLLSLQGADGLIRGGTDVTWVSTQHNLLAYTFLVRLANELGAAGAPYRSAAKAIGSGIDSNLFVDDDSGPHYIQGLKDDAEPIDVQAIGAMYLAGRGQTDLARQVLARANTNFALDLSITESSDPATYNESYEAEGTFPGFRSYSDYAIGGQVLWFDGSAMMLEATGAVGEDTGPLLKGTQRWQSVTANIPGAPPLQANQTFTSASSGVEYHVWPSTASAAWLLLAQKAPYFFAAPL